MYGKFSLSKAPVLFRSFSSKPGFNVFSNAEKMAEIYQDSRPLCLYTNAITKIISNLGVKKLNMR